MNYISSFQLAISIPVGDPVHMHSSPYPFQPCVIQHSTSTFIPNLANDSPVKTHSNQDAMDRTYGKFKTERKPVERGLNVRTTIERFLRLFQRRTIARKAPENQIPEMTVLAELLAKSQQEVEELKAKYQQAMEEAARATKKAELMERSFKILLEKPKSKVQLKRFTNESMELMEEHILRAEESIRDVEGMKNKAQDKVFKLTLHTGKPIWFYDTTSKEPKLAQKEPEDPAFRPLQRAPPLREKDRSLQESDKKPTESFGKETGTDIDESLDKAPENQDTGSGEGIQT
ncbi:hypothetical protein QBC39DRAFT_433371 [Podospora conica]|nr:hypothetical protein QBC39DRAFT_433371 [Schizothecium conicum]